MHAGNYLSSIAFFFFLVLSSSVFPSPGFRGNECVPLYMLLPTLHVYTAVDASVIYLILRVYIISVKENGNNNTFLFLLPSAVIVSRAVAAATSI